MSVERPCGNPNQLRYDRSRWRRSERRRHRIVSHACKPRRYVPVRVAESRTFRLMFQWNVPLSTVTSGHSDGQFR